MSRVFFPRNFSTGQNRCLVIDPSAYDSIATLRALMCRVTREWEESGVCTVDERELLVADVWGFLDGWQHGNCIAAFLRAIGK